MRGPGHSGKRRDPNAADSYAHPVRTPERHESTTRSRRARPSPGLALALAFALTLVIVCGAALWLLVPPSFSDPWPIDATLTSYYRDTYEENREAFRESCRTLKARLKETTAATIPMPGEDGDLTIDVCAVPGSPGAGDRLLIVTSGVHGSEGFASSAVQRMVMREIVAPAEVRPATLFVHGVNPYGMKHFRRVTAANVDLNRNFSTDPDLYHQRNPGYARVYDLLNPTGMADPRSAAYRLFPLRALWAIARTGMAPLRQAVLQGQYEFPRGLFYGGSEPEPQRALLDSLFRRETEGKGLVAIIDLHTGFGVRGRASLFPNHPPDDSVRMWTEQLFAGHTIDWPDSTSYSVQGEFCDYVGEILPEDARYVPMVLEFGTMDSQTTKGSIHSIKTTLIENQAHQFGCVSDEACRQIRAEFREMYFPSSPSWRTKILIDARLLFGHVIERIVSM